MPKISSSAAPADLCQHILPSGRPCRQITLKEEYFCRHHRRLFKKADCESAQEGAVLRLVAKVHSLELPGLLKVLYGRLSRLRSVVRASPETQIVLSIALERLRSELQSGSYRPGVKPRQTPANFPENPMKSMSQHILEFLKTLQNQ